MKKFEELYNEISENEELNTAWKGAREKQKRDTKIQTVIFLVSVLLCVGIIYKSKYYFIIPFLIMTILFLNIFTSIIMNFLNKDNKKYKELFKTSIIQELIGNFYTNLEYFPLKKMPERIYGEAKYKEYYNIYISDDYIEAKINNKYDIEMGEVLTQEEHTSTDSDGNTTTTTTTIFHGLFSKITIDKTINGELKITNNRSWENKKNKLEMDSSEFEKIFDVYSTNKIIGMQLLTADVMEELIEFRNKTGMYYDITIINNNIYLRFHCGSVFEPSALKKGTLDKGSIERYFYILNFTYNISNKIIKLINETEI